MAGAAAAAGRTGLQRQTHFFRVLGPQQVPSCRSLCTCGRRCATLHGLNMGASTALTVNSNAALGAPLALCSTVLPRKGEDASTPAFWSSGLHVHGYSASLPEELLATLHIFFAHTTLYAEG